MTVKDKGIDCARGNWGKEHIRTTKKKKKVVRSRVR